MVSLDERLVRSLTRSSEIVDPDVGPNLARARRRGSRLVLAHRAAGIAFLVAAAAGAFFVVPKLAGHDRTVPDVQPHSPTGSFEADVHSAAAPIRQYQLNGRWELSFLEDGRILFAGPPAARVRQLRPAYTFQTVGNVLTTDLFARDACSGDGPGRYRWSSAGSGITFLIETDSCPARRELLTSSMWSVTIPPPDDALEGTWWAAGITCEQGVAAEARAGFTTRELELGGRGRFASVRRCLASGRTTWDETVTFHSGRFVALCGSPTEGHLCVNGTYRIRHGVFVVNDGWSAASFRFAIDGDQLTLDVVDIRLVQPGMTRINRLEDWVAATFGYESKAFTRVT